MARNGSGTYTVPNAFVSGGTITASSHNQNYSDIGTELTNSVAADGQTTMTAALKHSNGTAAAPSITFASDTDSGFYRKAANSIGLALEGVDKVVWSTAAASFGIELIASATATFILTANFTLAPVVPAKSFAISKIADGTANRLYGTDGSGVATAITAGTGITISSSSVSASIVLPRGYVDGCILSNGTDATNDIDFSAGVCRDSTNTVNIICAAMAGKQLDANWAPGAAAGMRNSAAGIANGTYHCYAVAKADGTQDYYAHTSLTVATVITALQAETGGASYLYALRIGSIVRAGAALQAFTQDPDGFFRIKTPLLDADTSALSTTATNFTLASVPTGVSWRVQINVLATAGAARSIYLKNPSETDTAPSTSAAPLATIRVDSAGVAQIAQVVLVTNTSSQVTARSDGASTTLRMAPLGWWDNRGKNS